MGAAQGPREAAASPTGELSPPTPPGGSLSGGTILLPTPSRRGGETLLRRISGGVAAIPLLALLFIVVVLVLEAWPAIKVNGWSFFTTNPWQPGNTYGGVTRTHGVLHPIGVHYGALPLITGTLESSAIALIVAVPTSIGAALAVVTLLPRRIASAVGFFLELLAGIPSVVLGLWGAITLGPFLAHHIYPVIARNVPDVPVLNIFRGPTGSGEGLLTSGLVLAIMVIPIVASTCRDLIRQVPAEPHEGAEALGMTSWETARKVTLPWVRSGIIGASVLGLARALGETIAVAMVSGAVLGANAHNVYSTMTTIAATIVSQLDSAFSDATNFATRTLAEAALVLLAITLVTNVAARLLVKRTSGTALPVGRGV